MDIALIVIFCVLNAKNARERGRRPGAFIGATIGLCIVFMTIFVMIAIYVKGLTLNDAANIESLSELLPIAIGEYCGIGLGGLVSFFLAKKCRPGNYFPDRNGYPGWNNPNQNNSGRNYPGQNYPGQNYPGQNYPGQNYPGQNYPGQNYPGQNYPDPNYPGGNYPGRDASGQNAPGQGYPGQNYPGVNAWGYGDPNNQRQNGQPVNNPWQNSNQGNPWQAPPNRMANGQIIQDGEVYDAADPNVLKEPCSICIIREKSSEGADGLFTFSLNGHPVCRLMNGAYTKLITYLSRNTITARDATGMSLRYPVTFQAASGGYVEIHVKGTTFLRDKTIGKRPADETDSDVNTETKTEN